LVGAHLGGEVDWRDGLAGGGGGLGGCGGEGLSWGCARTSGRSFLGSSTTVCLRWVQYISPKLIYGGSSATHRSLGSDWFLNLPPERSHSSAFPTLDILVSPTRDRSWFAQVPDPRSPTEHLTLGPPRRRMLILKVCDGGVLPLASQSGEREGSAGVVRERMDGTRRRNGGIVHCLHPGGRFCFHQLARLCLCLPSGRGATTHGNHTAQTSQQGAGSLESPPPEPREAPLPGRYGTSEPLQPSSSHSVCAWTTCHSRWRLVGVTRTPRVGVLTGRMPGTGLAAGGLTLT
jgi:hypothetical protein